MPGSPEVYFTRHGNSPYKNNAETLASDNPQAAFNPDTQQAGDLTEKGIALAHEKAAELLGVLNPQTDSLFFVSSNEVRAIETANIYRQEAKMRGFEILKPEHTRSEFADETGDGDIRVLHNLSLNTKNALAATVFNPEHLLSSSIKWEAIDDEAKQKWAAARAIINADDKGSWGANYHAHSEEIKQIFPEMVSAQDLHNTQFQNLLRLVRWTDKKVGGLSSEKNVKVLAFGHENYISIALEEVFQKEGINNCETINVSVNEDKIKAEFRGEQVEIS